MTGDTVSNLPRQADRRGRGVVVNEVLVTGSSGFVGQHVAAGLAAGGWLVTGVDLVPPAGTVEGVRHVTADAADPRVLAEVAAGRYAAVVHQAAITDTLESDWARLRSVNVDGALALARACARAGARFVYASSHSVYGTVRRRVPVAEHDVYDTALCSGPLNPYARSKLLLDERMADGFGSTLAWAGLRYTNVFGDGELPKGRMACILTQLVRATASGERLTLFADSLTAARDYVPAAVVADAVRRLVEAPEAVESGVYNLGSGHAVTFATVVEWCARFGDGKLDVRLVNNPNAAAYQYWTCADNGRLDAALPDRSRVAPGDIMAEAERLHRGFRLASTAY
ncbi:NAD-dependent epimerase/dehydratase family protein [Rugosimonospora africana]|uniref:ADP-L-glycero-D-manno-heptose-6-epimerase n=1 Tax=Rugosimonospora africana TaxID=556532 RepID=A0A8J3QLP7_9ACTN|nr:NAD(P)-dependent oxidoreductase [Rugosimonospora africana]GIH11887.1 ADP-L-glycero-D-manno-heptose-6-epimerase [Rugosimonospora africana]